MGAAQLLLLFLPLLLVACGEPRTQGGDEPATISSPEATIESTSAATAAPALKPIVDSGWAIALMEGEMVAVPLPQEQLDMVGEVQLTTGTLTGPATATYAGYAGDWVYVVEHNNADIANHTARLTRTSLTDGRHE